jgi:hypothetical protein
VLLTSPSKDSSENSRVAMLIGYFVENQISRIASTCIGSSVYKDLQLQDATEHRGESLCCKPLSKKDEPHAKKQL